MEEVCYNGAKFGIIQNPWFLMKIPIHKKDFNKNLHQWYRKYHRKLPWRTRPSLYKTVVSEFMLQQTQVDTVLPYFEHWLKAFPDFNALAHASEADVLKHWEGLGYYSRARNLHKLAKQYITQTPPPKTAKEWIALPGVGPYTAAAIASIAFEDPVAVVDGNVIRILARITARDAVFKDNTVAVKAFTPLAQKLLDAENPNIHNQAVMELGATLCYRQKPLCTVCPVFAFCKGGQSGVPHNYPRFAPRKITHVSIDRLWVVHADAILLHRTSPHARRLANIYELPAAQCIPNIQEILKDVSPLITKKRAISNQRVQENIYKITAPLPPFILEAVKKNQALRWVKCDALDSVTLSGPHRRWIATNLSSG